MTPVGSLAGRRAYFDTNVFIYTLNGVPAFAPVLPPLLTAVETGRLAAVTSELAVAELLVKPFRDADARAEAACRAILFGQPNLILAPITRLVLIEAARLRAMTTLKLPDALHAATATLNGCDVLLTNDARFRLAGLSLNVILLAELTP